jgi:hypothetical protein
VSHMLVISRLRSLCHHRHWAQFHGVSNLSLSAALPPRSLSLIMSSTLQLYLALPEGYSGQPALESRWHKLHIPASAHEVKPFLAHLRSSLQVDDAYGFKLATLAKRGGPGSAVPSPQDAALKPITSVAEFQALFEQLEWVDDATPLTLLVELKRKDPAAAAAMPAAASPKFVAPSKATAKPVEIKAAEVRAPVSVVHSERDPNYKSPFTQGQSASTSAGSTSSSNAPTSSWAKQNDQPAAASPAGVGGVAGRAAMFGGASQPRGNFNSAAAASASSPSGASKWGAVNTSTGSAQQSSSSASAYSSASSYKAPSSAREEETELRSSAPAAPAQSYASAPSRAAPTAAPAVAPTRAPPAAAPTAVPSFAGLAISPSAPRSAPAAAPQQPQRSALAQSDAPSYVALPSSFPADSSASAQPQKAADLLANFKSLLTSPPSGAMVSDPDLPPSACSQGCSCCRSSGSENLPFRSYLRHHYAV